MSNQRRRAALAKVPPRGGRRSREADRRARGSLYELKDHLISCNDLELIDISLFERGIDLIEQAKATLNGFIKFVDTKRQTH